MKQNPTKKQHYIPQIYLKGFSNDGLKINAYWVNNPNIIEKRYIPIESVCRENYLYEFKKDDDTYFYINHIENCLSNLEGMFSDYKRKLLSKAFIKKNITIQSFFSSEEKYFWKLYIGIQMLRTPKVLNEAKSFSADFFGELLNKNAASNIALEQCLPLLKETKLGENNCLFSFIEPMQNMSIALGIDHNSRIITSDNPVYAFSSDKSVVNFKEVFFPINEQLVLFLGKEKQKEELGNNRLFIMSDEKVDTVIKSIAYSAENIVFSKNLISSKDKQLIISARKDKIKDRKVL